MTSDKQLLEQVLEALEVYATAYSDGNEAITALRQAIEQAEQAQPVAQLMDMIVGNLVREGINKHRARELAEHFIKQSNYTNGYCTGRADLLKEQAAQKPMAWTTGFHAGHCVIRAADPAAILPIGVALYTSPPPRQPLTEKEIFEISNGFALWMFPVETRVTDRELEFARAIEAAHGIKGDA